MVSSTRQSARFASQGDNDPAQSQEQTSPKGTKRKADTTSPKKGRSKNAEPEKKQKTLEESIGGDQAPSDSDMVEAAKAVEGEEKKAESKGEEAPQNNQQASEGGAEQEQATKDEENMDSAEVEEPGGSKFSLHLC